MKKKWCLLRGTWDERTQRSIDSDDDMWLQLFRYMVDGESHRIYFRDGHGQYGLLDDSYEYILSRGGFEWQEKMIEGKKCCKIFYGAGRRFLPKSYYDIILIDTKEQQKFASDAYRNAKVVLWDKPAAEHFKPMDVEKKYDLCFIANGQQEIIKGIEWVYDTAPKELSILHLGYPSRFSPPPNVFCKRVDRIDMPREISQCKIGILPYWSCVDSAPRALSEIIACGIPCVINRRLSTSYNVVKEKKEFFWDTVKENLSKPPPIPEIKTVKQTAAMLRKIIQDIKV